MPENTQSQNQVSQTPTKSSKGSLFWVLAVIGGILLTICCCCSLLSVALFSSPDFKEGFAEGYCEEFLKDGLTPEDDPFGLCLDY